MNTRTDSLHLHMRHISKGAATIASEMGCSWGGGGVESCISSFSSLGLANAMTSKTVWVGHTDHITQDTTIASSSISSSRLRLIRASGIGYRFRIHIGNNFPDTSTHTDRRATSYGCLMKNSGLLLMRNIKHINSTTSCL